MTDCITWGLYLCPGEQSRIDHLVFVVHGIGEHHDLNFRCLVDCGRHPTLSLFSTV